MNKIVLFTSFAPNIGGGAVNLNSIIPYFKEVKVEWLYLHDRDLKIAGCTHIGKPLTGGKIWQDLTNSLFLWSGIKTKSSEKILTNILDKKADVYWIVGLNEAIPIAGELASRTSTPIHFTIQDDVPYGVFARSRRYQWLSGIAQKCLADVMRRIRSLDVTSDGMRDYYQKTLGINGVVIHPYVPSLPTFEPISLDANSLTVGHIGTIYSLPEFRLFCQALQEYAKSKGLNAQLITIGLARKYATIIEEFPELIYDIPQLTEAEAIQHLYKCNFLYAMYPFNQASAIFRQTSLPTKLTTYIQAQRPIFAHTIADSSLASVVREYNLGLLCDRLDISNLTKAIEQMRNYELSSNCFENARAALYGYDNVTKLEKCLKPSL
ncbi:hypothetical protein ACE1CI_35090 [Aerosakkonemataceae cyanobacterium BLCC-F50]|uniref:Glycosyltransferase n=1 Tax=Floridaenema flaviceps BLCC-F50 TaxID=3153642 RepID=A0ABV4Y4E4_9CYAN